MYRTACHLRGPGSIPTATAEYFKELLSWMITRSCKQKVS